jgi:hypothetical protein
VIYPLVSSTTVDYAIGLATNTLWFSVPNSNGLFNWYAGTAMIASLNGFGSLQVAASFGVWNHAAPGSQPAVTGAKGGNAALASLLTALASYGLVTDSTT